MEDKDFLADEEDFVSDEEIEILSHQTMQNTAPAKMKDKKECACATQPQKLISITRTEAILMFVFTILLIGVLCFVCNKSLVQKIDRLGDDLRNLEVQMAVLSQQITEDNVASEKEPINVIVNIDGKQVSVGDDQTTATEPTEPEPFDESPFLGVAFTNTTSSQPNPIGLPIDYVYESSPAHLAGIKAGDIIMSVNGYEIKTMDNLTAVLAKCKAKDIIDITVASATETGVVCNTLSVTLTYKGNFDLD